MKGKCCRLHLWTDARAVLDSRPYLAFFCPVTGMGYSKLSINTLPQDQIASHDRHLSDVYLEMGIQSMPLKDGSLHIKPTGQHGTWLYNSCLING